MADAHFHVTQNWDGTENLYLDGSVILERADPVAVKKKRDILITAFLISSLEPKQSGQESGQKPVDEAPAE